MTFQEQGYTEVKQIIPVEICKLFTDYALLKERFNFKPEDKMPKFQDITVYTEIHSLKYWSFIYKDILNKQLDWS